MKGGRKGWRKRRNEESGDRGNEGKNQVKKERGKEGKNGGRKDVMEGGRDRRTEGRKRTKGRRKGRASSFEMKYSIFTGRAHD